MDDIPLEPSGEPPPPGGFPQRRLESGLDVPDLARIPRQRWYDALAPLPALVRRLASENEVAHAEFSSLIALWGKLELDDAARGQRVRAAAGRVPSWPEPPPAPPLRRRGRQVNVRLGEEDTERLGRAARIFGTSSTQLARMLIVHGAKRMLEEHARLG